MHWGITALTRLSGVNNIARCWCAVVPGILFQETVVCVFVIWYTEFVLKCSLLYLSIPTRSPLADPEALGAQGPLAPKICSQSCSFQALLRENPYFEHISGSGFPGVKTPLVPLTKILEPPLMFPARLFSPELCFIQTSQSLERTNLWAEMLITWLQMHRKNAHEFWLRNLKREIHKCQTNWISFWKVVISAAQVVSSVCWKFIGHFFLPEANCFSVFAPTRFRPHWKLMYLLLCRVHKNNLQILTKRQTFFALICTFRR